MNFRKYLNLLAFVGVIVVNGLANALPINGKTTGAVSAMYNNYFTPAGFTFSIWSIIYLSLLVLMVYQLKARISRLNESLDESLGFLLLINFLANMAWIYSWHYGLFFLTLIWMVVLLVTLIVVTRRTQHFGWIVRFPLQLYLGWICVATIANIAVYLTYLGWDGFGLTGWIWGATMVIIAGVLAGFLAVKAEYLVASLTVAWGVFGIYGKQMASTVSIPQYEWVCLGVILVVVVLTIGAGLKGRRNRLSMA